MARSATDRRAQHGTATTHCAATGPKPRSPMPPQQHDTTTTHYAATLGDVTDTGLRWAQCVHSAAWSLNTQIHAVGHGAP